MPLLFRIRQLRRPGLWEEPPPGGSPVRPGCRVPDSGRFRSVCDAGDPERDWRAGA